MTFSMCAIHLFVDHGQRSINCHYAKMNHQFVHESSLCICSMNENNRIKNENVFHSGNFYVRLQSAHSACIQVLKHVRKDVGKNKMKKTQRNNVMYVLAK